jgi:copper transport protein
MGFVRRVVIIGSVAAAAILAARRVLYAHAMLVSSEPAADSVVATSPIRVRLEFSEEIEPSLATVSLIRSNGRVDRLVVSGDPHDVNAIIAPVSGLTHGGYRVSWRVVSADGHPVSGSYAFWVTAKNGTPPPNATADQGSTTTTWGPTIKGAPAIPAFLRALAVGSAMALTGMLLLYSWRRDDSPVDSPSVKRLMRALAWGTPLLFALHFVAWLLNASPTHDLTGEALRAALGAGVGRVELWRIGLSLLAVWALLLMRRPRIALLFAVAVVTLSGATGHSAAIQPMQATPAKALHLVAGSVWLGGLLWLITAERQNAGQFEREVLRVSSLALWSVIAVAASGVLMALLFLRSPWDLVHSPYGVVMLTKLVGLVALVGFGAYHRYRMLPALQHDSRRGGEFVLSLRRELSVMVVVIFLGGLLAYVSPPRAPLVHRPPAENSVE